MASRMVLLRALGRAGGPQALRAVQTATKDADASVQDEAVRVLIGWSDASVAPALLALAKSAANPKHQVLGALSNVQTVESLRLVVPCLGDAALAEEASAATVKIAGKVADSAKDITRDAMQKVLQQSKNDNVRKEAEKILKKVGG